MIAMVRYLARRWLSRTVFGPPRVERVSGRLLSQVTHAAWDIFRSPELRRLMTFEKIDQTEQDRIFNELVVCGLTLVLLSLETVTRMVEDDAKVFTQSLRQDLSIAYARQLGQLGIAKKYQRLWNRLVEMRCDEYREDWLEYRAQLPDPEHANPWPKVIAIGGLHHLRRGKTSPQDPMFSQLIAWIHRLDAAVTKTMTRALIRV